MAAAARIRTTVITSLALLLCSATAALADKASVTISAPDSVKRGTEVTVTIRVTHSGNNFLHHVDWANLSAGGKELTRWSYSWRNLPEAAGFAREFKFVVEGPVSITAQADCNIHGSKGPQTKTINVTE
jgi:desulfoferrodoxin (superoxide reductase-like protein)